MAFESIRVAIESECMTQWDNATPIAWDNIDFDKPSNPKESWVRVHIEYGITAQASMGTKRTWRTPGVVFVQCFSALDKGTKESATLADDVKNVFQGLQVSGVTFRGTSLVTNEQSGEWWMGVTATDFFADEQI